MATPRYRCDVCGEEHYQDSPGCVPRAEVLAEALKALLATLPTCSKCEAPATNKARYRYGCDEHREWRDDMGHAPAVRGAVEALRYGTVEIRRRPMDGKQREEIEKLKRVLKPVPPDETA